MPHPSYFVVQVYSTVKPRHNDFVYFGFQRSDWMALALTYREFLYGIRTPTSDAYLYAPSDVKLPYKSLYLGARDPRLLRLASPTLPIATAPLPVARRPPPSIAERSTRRRPPISKLKRTEADGGG